MLLCIRFMVLDLVARHALPLWRTPLCERLKIGRGGQHRAPCILRCCDGRVLLVQVVKVIGIPSVRSVLLFCVSAVPYRWFILHGFRCQVRSSVSVSPKIGFGGVGVLRPMGRGLRFAALCQLQVFRAET